MSYFMDYGPDWPPAPEPPKPPAPPRRGRPVWKRALALIVTVAVIWALGALVLHMLMPADMNLVPSGPYEGHTTYATTTVRPSPHPATHHHRPQ